MEIHNLKNKKAFLREYIEICLKEWGSYTNQKNFDDKVDLKLNRIITGENDKIIATILLIDKEILVGFISLLKTDGDEKQELTPWYGTMYVKNEYRGKGYSKILNDEILKEAKRLGYEKVYLKTDLINYYEKFGAKIIGTLENKENLYYIDL